MANMIQELIKDTQDKMDNTLKTLDHQLSGIRTGKASPALVENISVLYYGAPTRMRDLANISTPEARLLVISPYDPTVIGEIERSILAANIGVTPVSDGRVVRVPVPELSEERRKEMVKVVRQEGEGARVAIRNIRRDSISQVKDLHKQKVISEDEERQAEEAFQKLTDRFVDEVDAVVEAKEADLMEV